MEVDDEHEHHGSVARNHRFPSCAIPASEVRASVTCVVVLVYEVSALANWCV